MLMSPVYKLTKKDVPFNWSRDCEKAFKEIKKRLTNAPILAPPDLSSNEPLHVTIDGSSHGTGWIIEQNSTDPNTGNKILRTVLYGSKNITDTERKYWEKIAYCI